MSNAVRSSQLAMRRSSLKVHQPDSDQPCSASWLINGYPATIFIWTAEEWAKLADRPVDAQSFPNGIWCALRID